MKKVFLFLMTIFAIFAFVSCATAKVEAIAPVEEPSTLATSSSSNDWWDNPPDDTANVHYEIGIGEGSTLQISRDCAKANANAALAQYVVNAVDAIVIAYTNDAGETSKDSNNMQAIQAFESLSKQRAQENLTGVTYKFHTMDNGQVFVLSALPIGPLVKELKAIVTEAFVNNNAPVGANNMMNATIDKYFN